MIRGAGLSRSLHYGRGRGPSSWRAPSSPGRGETGWAAGDHVALSTSVYLSDDPYQIIETHISYIYASIHRFLHLSEKSQRDRDVDSMLAPLSTKRPRLLEVLGQDHVAIVPHGLAFGLWDPLPLSRAATCQSLKSSRVCRRVAKESWAMDCPMNMKDGKVCRFLD